MRRRRIEVLPSCDGNLSVADVSDKIEIFMTNQIINVGGKMNITFSVAGNEMSITKKSAITAHSVAYPGVEFTFDEEWDSLSKSARFQNPSYGRSMSCSDNGRQVHYSGGLPFTAQRHRRRCLRRRIYTRYARGKASDYHKLCNVCLSRGRIRQCDAELPTAGKSLDGISRYRKKYRGGCRKFSCRGRSGKE